MRRKQNFSIGEYYHLYSRGVNKADIFFDDSDKERFLKLLYLSNGTKPFNFRDFHAVSGDTYKRDRGNRLVDIGVYCLMPNHFHILVREIVENGTTLFMRKLLTAYVMYFNLRQERTGALFESRFKATHVGREEYLKYLYSYIHLNPIKITDPQWRTRGVKNLIGAEDYLNKYKYSSYVDYIGVKRPETAILNRESFPEYFTAPKDFSDFIKEWLLFSQEEHPEDGPRDVKLSTEINANYEEVE